MQYSGKTDVGMKRSVNQDNFSIKEYAPGILLAVVCDGMGGARGGFEASSTATESFVACMDSFVESHITEQHTIECTDSQIHRALRRAAFTSNKAVFQRSEEDASLRGMGTTLVCVLVVGSTVYTANVGDSRMYIVRAGEIEQITHDHSYVQYLVDIGRLSAEEARSAQNRNIITRAVGTESSVDADVFVTEVDSGDEPAYVLLCSDGLTNHIGEEELAEIISSGEEINAKTDTLVQRANKYGGSDNITAVVIQL
ncbi:MAG: Stp1/IreP family PP2C-type Ser/Thr phosphatase [Ruminococcaceae bacterium]|nr:Stp1/IreP family PP2C-type Ser/Thr phosphatase [Oscillospiraceae bacterium]